MNERLSEGFGRLIGRGALRRAGVVALVVLTLLQAVGAWAQPAVLQRGYDANVSGATLTETTLNTSNVAPGGFGLVFTLAVDDNIMAQPLYVPNVPINGSAHNVLYVATMSDTLYAFDADVGGAPLWTRNLATLVGATPVPVAQFAYSGNKNLIGNLGILSTPVIDAATNTLYAVAATLENNAIVYRLHAIDIASGTPRSGSGVIISGSFGAMTFDARNEWQRVSLVLSGNNVVFGFGALELESTANLYSGWVMAYDKSTLAQTGIFATVTSGNGGAGVWQSGRPPVVDGAGYVYLFTGNGYSGTGYDGVHNFSESVLKLDPANGLALVDWFTPSNWSTLDSSDKDLSSAGPLLLPGTSLLAGGGKAGVLYVLNSGALGKNTANDSGAVQELTLSAGSIRGGPVYWQRSSVNGGPLLFDWGSKDQLKAFPFNGSTFATTPSALGSVTNQVFPGGILTLSANGDTPGTGVLWATVSSSGDSNNNPPTPGALYAFDAGNVARQLWNSNMNPAHDSPGNFAKFVPPLAANGRVYVATWSQQVAVYGLTSEQVATPTFSPAPGTYGSTQSVTLSDTTVGASIYYTTNGTTPTTSSTLFNPGTPITVSSSTTLKAMAVAGGYSNSAVASGSYVINTTSGGATSVSLSGSANVDGIVSNGSAVPNGGIDGLGDAYSAALLGSSLSWNGNTFALGSPGVADAVSNVTVPLPAGSYTTLSLLATGVNGNQPNQVFTVNYTDGTSSSFTQSLSDWFSPQNYAGESKALTMAYRITSSGALDNRTFYLYGYSFALNSAKTVASLTLPKTRNVIVLAADLSSSAVPVAATPSFSPAPGTFGSAQSVTLADTTAGASIYYTTDGTTPTTSSKLFTAGSPITVSSTTTIKAMAVASGYSNSAVASGTYVINSTTGGATAVSLSGSANVVGIVNNGSAVPNGGLDGLGYAYSATLLGSSLGWNGNTFVFGSPGVADAVSNVTVPLPAGSYTTLSLLATGVNGNRPGQVFTVNYTDGTSSSFTQSVSDWFTPQNYPGESRALTMAYRVTPNGTLGNGTLYLYGYSFAINSAKTVASLTLPKTRNVVVLAVDLSTVPLAAAPSFSPAPGTFSSTQSVTLSDATAGASIYYTTDGTTPTTSSKLFTSGTPITVSSTTTIKAIAVASGYSNSAVASGTYVINTGSATSVPLSGSANVVAMVSNGSAVPNGGIDGLGYAYSATLLGSSLSWNGNAFTFGSPGIADAVGNLTVPLPQGNYTTLSLLATGLNGNQPNQVFTVNYTDGTSSSFTQSVSDWFTPQSYAGESKALTMAYRITPSGALDNRTFYLYGYSFALNSAKSVASLTLPKTRNVVVLAADLH